MWDLCKQKLILLFDFGIQPAYFHFCPGELPPQKILLASKVVKIVTQKQSSLLLMSRQGVNFIKILLTALTRADPKSAKNNVKLYVFFVLSGSGRAKAACRALMKLNLNF